MSESDDKTYNLEPDADPVQPPPASEEEPASPPDSEAIDDSIEVSRGVEPLSLEEVDLSTLELPDRSAEEPEDKPGFEIEEPEVEEGESAYVRSLDVCPNCGKQMGNTKNLVCVNCGYDLKTMQVIQTKTGVTTKEEEDAKRPRKPKRLCKSTALDPWLPLALLGGAVLVMFIGYMVRPESLAIGEDVGRMKSVLVEFGVLLLWFMAGAAAVYGQSKLLERPIGDVELMLLRVAAMVAMTRPALFVDAPQWLEMPLETLLRVAIAWPLSMYFFRLKYRDALLLVALVVMIYLPLRGITSLL